MNCFNCDKCNRIFSKKHHLTNHLNKKTQCKPILIYKTNNDNTNLNTPKLECEISNNTVKCVNCFTTFTRKESLKRHLNGYCKVLKSKLELEQLEEQQNKKNNLINVEDIEKMNLDKNAKNVLTNLLLYCNNLTNEITEIKKELINEKEKNNKTNTVTNTNCNNTTTNTQNTQNTQINNNNNNVINIIAHGKEDLTKIELDTIMTCLSTFTHREIIPNMTKHIYLNDDKPENQNICVVDLARNKCKYHDGEKWIIGKSSEKVNKVFDNIFNMLTDPFEKENILKTTEFIKANPKKFNSTFIKVSNTYLKSLYDEDDKENMENKAKVLEEMKLIFFNNRDEIMRIKLKDDKKTKKIENKKDNLKKELK